MTDLEDFLRDYGLTLDDVEREVAYVDRRGVPVITAWTAELVIFTHDYDGCVTLRAVPRNPTDDGAGLVW